MTEEHEAIREKTTPTSGTFEPRGAASGIGGMPHTDPARALDLIFATCPEMPFWPQLPKRDFHESMYIQYMYGFPGLGLGGVDGRSPVLRTTDDLTGPMTALYEDYLAGRTRPIHEEWAAGYAAYLADPRVKQARWAKGQVTGPVSMGQAVTDEEGKLLLYLDDLMDAAIRHLNMVARGMEERLTAVNPATVVFFDEPSLSTFGSAYFSYDRPTALAHLAGVKEGLGGLTGVHCCGNTDWSLLLEAGFDVLSFDAYYYAERLALYAEQVVPFLERGGVLAWGIVPTDHQDWAGETARTLLDKLEARQGALVTKGADEGRIERQSLITASCGLGSLDVGEAERVLELVAEVSALYRQKHGL